MLRRRTARAMTPDPRHIGRLAVALTLLLLSEPAPSAGGPGAPCCYTNPRYAGPCAVEPATGETCASILAYLNNPRSQGKTYCNSTNVRGGWRQVRCARSSQAVSVE
jgi:hypothetical protein